MELENADGTTIPINDDSATDIGRNLGLGFPPSSPDRTVSRRHLSLRPTAGPRVSFRVLGRNPIVVHEADTGAERIYKNSESGELSVGDKLSLSLKNPSFVVLNWRNGKEEQEDEEDAEKRRILDAVERREKRTLERRSAKRDDEEELDLGSEDLDLSEFDPVKEFGFLVKGHEFDQYPKGMVVDFKRWNWFLEEPRKNNGEDDGSDDEVTRSKGKRVKKTYRGVDEDEDEEWAGESDEEKVVVVKGGSSKRPKYSTRSKEVKKPRKDVKARKDEVDNDEEDEDEEDETLGGFIVDEDEEEQEVNEEESEEELEEEDEDEDEGDDE